MTESLTSNVVRVPDTNDHQQAQQAMLRSPAQVLFGDGARCLLPQAVAEFGERAFVCSDPVIATSTAFQRTMAMVRAIGVEVEVVSDVEPELPLAGLDRVTEKVRRYRPDVLIGFGGGSTLDLAKLLALTAVTDQPLAAYYGEHNVPRGVLPVVAVPTTAGTGSEATPVAVIADPTRRLKVGISSPRLIPTVAVVDPELALSCPSDVTAHSGIDALAHACEAFTARPTSVDLDTRLPVFVGANPMTDDLALEAAHAVMNHLPTAVVNPDDIEARGQVAYGSMVAGLAFGTAGTHLSHAIQYPIGDLSHTPHGLGVGLMLPYVLEACLGSSADRIARLGHAMEVSTIDMTDQDAACRTIRAIVALREQIGIPHTLADIGIRKIDLDELGVLAAGVTRLVANAPMPDPPAKIPSILNHAFEGKSDVFSGYTTSESNI